jgi:hypothetical protein
VRNTIDAAVPGIALAAGVGGTMLVVAVMAAWFLALGALMILRKV